LCIALAVAAPVAAGAGSDAPPVASGLVLFGNILPAPSLVPVMDGLGVPSNFPPGPDVVTGFDRAGRPIFRRTFRDKIYNFYLFVQLGRAQISGLHRLRLQVQGHTLERIATVHGAARARAQTIGFERVRITWNARDFPRLACHDEGGGSPAPLMLGGDFTAADVRGNHLRCDFSDGVKTAYHEVLVPILGAKTRS
jgi:hypothetical protein